MRFGVISDVHANLPALKVVLDFFKSKNIDRILHAGDVIGYNAFPIEVIEAFKEYDILSIAGNHDRGIAGLENPEWFNPEARKALSWTILKMGNRYIEYVKNLPQQERFKKDGKSLVIAHGHPADGSRYTWESEVNDSILDDADADILILGHTHVPFIKRMDNGLVFNPGSVGQPRDGDCRVSCAILDVRASDIKIFRLDYPIEKMVNANLNAGLPLIFAERLRHGI